jgi:hypothetical protein
MKTALIGLSNNVTKNINKITLWAKSFKKYSNGEVILLCANSTQEDLVACQTLGIKPVPVVVKDTWYINHDRLKHTYEYIKSSDIDMFIATDVFDVAFQGNPFDKLNTVDYDLFVSGEGVSVGEEPWNADNIIKIFPESIEICRPTEVINSGIIAGKKDALSGLLQRMYELCERGSNAHNIKDQAALIVMIAKKEIERLKIFNLDDGWAMHCAVAGPTQFFEAWGFKGKIKYGIPKMKDGVVVNKNDSKYDIVHQFNRVPEWERALKLQNNL